MVESRRETDGLERHSVREEIRDRCEIVDGRAKRDRRQESATVLLVAVSPPLLSFHVFVEPMAVRVDARSR